MYSFRLLNMTPLKTEKDILNNFFYKVKNQVLTNVNNTEKLQKARTKRPYGILKLLLCKVTRKNVVYGITNAPTFRIRLIWTR